MDIPIEVGQGYTLTLPTDVCARYDIQEGDVYYLTDLDGVLILTPMAPRVAELAREIERLRLEAGLSTDDLLVGLREQREK